MSRILSITLPFSGSTPCSLFSNIALLPYPLGCQPRDDQNKTPVGGSSESKVERAGPKWKKVRRARTIFSQLQLVGLENKFQRQKYLSTPDRLDVARSLGLTQLQVKTWYQNRRMKWKKMVLETGRVAPTKPKGRPRKNSIPTMQEIEAAEQLAGLAEAQKGQSGAPDLNPPGMGVVFAPCGPSVLETQGVEHLPGSPLTIQQTSMGVTG
ncbi:hypothetical protein Z043_117625 [Scleropages formosus]|uniref:Homeobox domain-containing protein n=1 Tax=Scleropages formosus TaxID=113540 RepID=A0A0P7YCS6_SCLFO|nr:hypothetical protein Z043_117625 [Scleropages formosus]